MRIAIDGSALLLRSAGVKSVVYHWVRALRAEAPGDEISLYPPIARIGALDHQASVATVWETARGLAMNIANQRAGLRFPEWCTRGVDVFHCSNQVAVPPRGPKLTATIHDLTCWTMPELHTAGNIEADKRHAARILRRADGVIAVSECTRRDAIELLGLRDQLVTAIPNGVADEYFCAVPLQRAKPYVLSCGTIEPRKNIDLLLDAWAALPGDVRDAFDLVVAGPQGWGADATAARLRRAPKGIEWLGYVAEEQMPGLTAGASLLVYPSLYEGFGLPLAQAMAAGVACVTSNVSAMPEVAGEGAVLIDPRSQAELTLALRALLENDGRRRELGSAGRAKAEACYRWGAVARRSLDFFRTVCGR